jgi:hypothetical protein
MCCFSGPVLQVSKTRIFARRTAPDRQALIYSMHLSARQDLAMVLPLPLPPQAGEDALRFVDLSGYVTLFDDLDAGIPEPTALKSRGVVSRSVPTILKVHEVGDFEASFVPSVGDFERLDPRFRMPPRFFEALPDYRDYGFAVFQLRGWRPEGFLKRVFRQMEEKTIHPMAFEFQTRDPRIFLPTVHVHDGEVHPQASFDHALYYQGQPGDYTEDRQLLSPYFVESQLTPLFLRAEPTLFGAQQGFPLRKHSTSLRAAEQFVDLARAKGLVAEGLPCHRFILEGQQPNSDCWVQLAA